MSILLYFILFLLPPTLFALLFMKKIKDPKKNLPPSPPKLPIIGNLHQFRGLFHRCLHDLAKKHGPVLLLRLGFVNMVVISSKEAAEEVLKTHDHECCTRPKTIASSKFTRNGKDIAFAPYGEVTKVLRKLSVLNFFSTKKVRSFRYIREEENDLMVKKLKESALKKSSVDLSQTLFCLVGNIIFRSAFGQRFDESKHVNQEKIKELMFEVQTVGSLSSSDLFPTGVGWFMDFVSGRSKKLHKVFVEVDTLMNHIIDDHLRNPIEETTLDRPDIIDSLLDITNKQEQDESFKLTIDHLKGIIQDIYLAGVDTSAITMIWAMTELVRNPRVMKKAQDEIRSCIGIKQNGRIDEEDVDKLQYLKLVIKETLRLHLAAPLLLPRETMVDIKIQGYDIPRKTILLVNAWSIGRDPKLWENPEEFNPERFINSPIDYKGNNFEMLPFGSGRRICPGIAFGISTVELGLLNFLYFFDWRMPEENQDMDMEEAGDATIVKKVPLKLLPVLYH
ncbi:PREDICTED: cytochrome P450 71B3-like [Camelina sativa]|uniref:Cytochrome P450 71B3-like n=1 Tax=Camelina sativa TaxID=90675 RepID=A0ABM0TES0_CAMSA|nr:PREDICTED: cytochrome P450 71B3-like [Camelina sativa]